MDSSLHFVHRLFKMFPWEKRPQSATFTRRNLLQHHYSTDDALKTSGIKSLSVGCAEWKSSNARLTTNIRNVECRVDTGKNRNAAVAYWSQRKRCDNKRPSTAPRQRIAGEVRGPLGTSSSTAPCAAVSGDGNQPDEAIHIVYVSPSWRAAKCHNTELSGDSAAQSPRSLLTVPWKTSTTLLPDGSMMTVQTAHQHIRFSNPAPPLTAETSLAMSDVVEPSTAVSDERNLLDRSESPPMLRETKSPLSSSTISQSSPLSGSTNVPTRKPSRRHRASIQTAADLLADVAITESISHRVQVQRSAEPPEEISLLSQYGAPARCRRWQAALLNTATS